LGHQPWIVYLQEQTGIGDGLVLFAQYVGEREDIFFVRFVVLVPDPELDIGR
jgi:hypothetical protein